MPTTIDLLTLGQLDHAYDRLTSRVVEGDRVLDLGCGTGTLTLKCALRNARVKGIDTNPQMLEIAHKRVNEAGLADRVELREVGFIWKLVLGIWNFTL